MRSLTMCLILTTASIDFSLAMQIGATEGWPSPPPPFEPTNHAHLQNLMEHDPCSDIRPWHRVLTQADSNCQAAASGLNAYPPDQRPYCPYTERPKCRGFIFKRCTVLIRRHRVHPRRVAGFKYEQVSLKRCASTLNLNVPPPPPPQ